MTACLASMLLLLSGARVASAATQPDCTTVTGNLVANCGFESPSIGVNNIAVGPAGFRFGGWVAGAGGVEIDGTNRLQANSGSQFLELSFALAGNPGCTPPLRTLTVTFGSTSQSFQFDTTGKTKPSMGWISASLGAIPASATGSSTRLDFTSTTSGSCGATLDDVVVVEAPATPTPTLTQTPTSTPTSTPTATPTVAANATSTATPTPTRTGGPSPMPMTPTPTSSWPSPGLPRGRSASALATPATPGAEAASSSRPPTSTPTLVLDCGQNQPFQSEPGAAPGYVNDPTSPQGQPHSHYGRGPLATLADRDRFRSSLPPGTNLGPVNDAIARGCSAPWIRDHIGSLSGTATE